PAFFSFFVASFSLTMYFSLLFPCIFFIFCCFFFLNNVFFLVFFYFPLLFFLVSLEEKTSISLIPNSNKIQHNNDSKEDKDSDEHGIVIFFREIPIYSNGWSKFIVLCG